MVCRAAQHPIEGPDSSEDGGGEEQRASAGGERGDSDSGDAEVGNLETGEGADGCSNEGRGGCAKDAASVKSECGTKEGGAEAGAGGMQQGQGSNGESAKGDGRQPRFWTAEEHKKFLEAVRLYGYGNARQIAAYVQTRNITQVRTHAQKYILKLSRMGSAATNKVCGALATVSARQHQHVWLRRNICLHILMCSMRVNAKTCGSRVFATNWLHRTRLDLVRASVPKPCGPAVGSAQYVNEAVAHGNGP